jgi:hypothetical protein
MVLRHKWRRGPKGMLFREPSAINGAQVITNTVAAAAGLMAAIGGFPVILTGQIGPVLSAAVGSVLVIGGVIGAIAVLYGNWWLERVSLLITGLGWVLMLPASLSFAASGRSSGGIWLVVALLFAALGDVFKRYLRIQWAYLDPQR